LNVCYPNYYLQCLNYENYYNINENRDYLILIKDGKYYFPIYNVKKGTKDKKIILTKKYNNNNTIIDELKKYSLYIDQNKMKAIPYNSYKNIFFDTNYNMSRIPFEEYFNLFNQDCTITGGEIWIRIISLTEANTFYPNLTIEELP
jgi:hypothetical protein